VEVGFSKVLVGQQYGGQGFQGGGQGLPEERLVEVRGHSAQQSVYLSIFKYGWNSEKFSSTYSTDSAKLSFHHQEHFMFENFEISSASSRYIRKLDWLHSEY